MRWQLERMTVWKCITYMYMHRLSPNASWQELLLVYEWLNGLTDSWRFLPSVFQKMNSVWPHLNCMDGSVLAFLNCTDGSVLTHLNGSYNSVLYHLRFPTQSDLTWFPQSGISLVPWLLCKKSNKKHVWNRMMCRCNFINVYV